MFNQVFTLFTQPLIFLFIGFFLLSRFKDFRKLDSPEKMLTSLAVGVSLFTCFFVLAGVSPLSFRLVSKITYFLFIFVSIMSLIRWRGRVMDYLVNMMVKTKRLFSGDIIDLLFMAVLIVFVTKLVLFLLLKPVVDADVIKYYLPFARTFFRVDHIPAINFYDSTPIFFPPVGISVLFAFSYSIVNSLFSENFRLIPLPFILGTVGVLYLFVKRILGDKAAKLTTVIFLTLPFWDDFGLAGFFYPDIIFLFLALLVFYLLWKIFEQKDRTVTNFLAVIAGISLGSSILFKFQAVFLYYFLFLFGLRSFMFLGKRIKFILPFLAVFPFFLNFSKLGLPNYSLSVEKIILLVILFFVLVNFFGRKTIKNRRELNLSILILLVSLPFGLLWFVRNYFVFGHLLSLITPERRFMWGVASQVFSSGFTHSRLVEWTIFLVPSLASFWVIPKLIFFLTSLAKKKLIFPLVWIVGWYAFWFSYLDGRNIRHFIPIFPFVGLMVFVGLNWIGAKILKPQKAVQFSLVAVVMGFLFSFFQSIFLWWNWGIIFYGPETLYRIVKEETTSQQSFFISSLYALARKILIVFNSQEDVFLNYLPQLAVLSVSISLLILMTAFFGTRFIKTLYRFRRRTVVIASLWLLLPYFFTFYVVSEGNISRFAQMEQKKVYSYWGLTEIVAPYLIKNVPQDEAIVLFGVPQLGLSYLTNHKVYNLLAEDLGEIFKPIFYETDPHKIYLFLRERNIDYFVIGENEQSKEAMIKFKGLTKIPLVLENRQYFQQEIFPDDNVQWAVYRIRK